MGARGHRRWGGIGVPVAVLLALLTFAPAAAAQLPRTSEPLPGSTFQGGDGNQDDGVDAIDWQALQAQERVRHSPDDNDEDTAFVGGSEELEPGEWDLTTEAGGVNPAKDNIRDAWSSVDQPGERTFVQLAFTRESGVGTTFVSFELNHDDQLWDNGQRAHPVPAHRRRPGLLRGRRHGRDVRDPPLDHDGRRSRPRLCAPWALRGVRAAEVERGRPGRRQLRPDHEPAARRLHRTPCRSGGSVRPRWTSRRCWRPGSDEECMAFTSVWMHSRSSIADSSNLQDYVAPRRLDVRTCSASGTKFFDRDADGVRDPASPASRGS